MNLFLRSAILILFLPLVARAQPATRNSVPQRTNFTSAGRLRAFAADMLAHGKIVPERYRMLLSAIDSQGVTTSIDLLSYLDRTVTFDMHTLPRQPADYYRIIFERIAGIVPGFNFTNLRVTLLDPADMPDDDDNRLLITMEIGGRTYTQRTYYSSSRGSDDADLIGMVGDDFYEIVNKWLADEKAPYRLHHAECEFRIHGMDAVCYDRIGLIALSAKEDSLFDTYGADVMLVFRESFDEYIGPRGIGRAIAAYRELHLLDHLSNAEIEEGTGRALSGHITNGNDILAAFKGVIATVAYEGADADSVYAGLLRELAAITHGAFTPTNIRDDYRVAGKRSSQFSFDVRGRTYRTKLTTEEDWLDTKAFDLIDSALAQSGAGGRFYAMGEDADRLIFLTPQQHSELEKRGLLRFAKESDRDDDDDE